MTKTNPIVIALVAMFMAVCTSATAAVTDLDGYRYQGIGKMKGQPMDAWVDMKFDDTDIDFKIMGSFKFSSSYKLTSTGNAVKVTAKIPGAAASVFTSTDSADSFEGKIAISGIDFDIWAVRVPAKLVPATLPDAELEKIIGDPAGYTAFNLLENDNGQVLSVTSEFVCDNADRSFKIVCDNPVMQKYFDNFSGTYKVEGGKIILDNGKASVSGDIYNNGNYLKIIMGKQSGLTLALVLIR